MRKEDNAMIKELKRRISRYAKEVRKREHAGQNRAGEYLMEKVRIEFQAQLTECVDLLRWVKKEESKLSA